MGSAASTRSSNLMASVTAIDSDYQFGSQDALLKIEASLPTIRSDSMDVELNYVPPSSGASVTSVELELHTVCFKYQSFLELVKSNSISLQTADEYVLQFPASLFAIDADGKCSIQHAGDNRNIPLFQLLMKRKQEARRQHVKKATRIIAQSPTKVALAF